MPDPLFTFGGPSSGATLPLTIARFLKQFDTPSTGPVDREIQALLGPKLGESTADVTNVEQGIFPDLNGNEQDFTSRLVLSDGEIDGLSQAAIDRLIEQGFPAENLKHRAPIGDTGGDATVSAVEPDPGEFDPNLLEPPGLEEGGTSATSPVIQENPTNEVVKDTQGNILLDLPGDVFRELLDASAVFGRIFGEGGDVDLSDVVISEEEDEEIDKISSETGIDFTFLGNTTGTEQGTDDRADTTNTDLLNVALSLLPTASQTESSVGRGEATELAEAPDSPLDLKRSVNITRDPKTGRAGVASRFEPQPPQQLNFTPRNETQHNRRGRLNFS